MGDTYRAAKNRSQRREGWCILFRHPLRRDAQGKPLRVRRGLGTRHDGDADRLVDQMNRLLGDESYWTPAARDRALRDVDPLIVSIFYDDIEPKFEDSWAVRDSVIPIPGPEDGYARVLFLGPTGAGKTTLVRQLIGSDPRYDRFPSTSTAKTTVFDAEIVLAEGQYRAVASFLSRDRVRHHIEECVAAATSAAAEGAKEDEIARRLLEHREQRFRLSYLLGTLSAAAEEETDEDLEDADEKTAEFEPPEVGLEERKQLEARLRSYLSRVTHLAESVRGELANRLNERVDALKAADRDAFLELLEDTVREDEEAQSLIDEILEDVESRFELLEHGQPERDRSGWPIRWVFETEDRTLFIKTINRFSSNYAPNFGRLLAPLVQGLRVAGPFQPVWHRSDGIPKLVLTDGEGLGHTPDSAWSLPTAITKRYERSDVILLVDNATQPMVASPQAVLRSVAASGHESKLVVVFTHFDQVKGDNLPNETSKRNHVRASLDNAIYGIDAALGPGAGRSLRRYLEGKVFFVGGIDESLPPHKRSTRAQLTQLVQVFRAAIAPPEPIQAVPVYDMANLVLGATVAARQFQDSWDARLPAEHWARVKALTRRLGYLGEDEYDTLKPVADMIRLLSEQVRAFIAAPRNWHPEKPSEEMCQAVIDLVSREFFSRLHIMASSRLWTARLREWQQAYERRGPGSGNLRKHEVKSIYSVAAPVPGAAPVPDASEFLDEIRSLFREATLAAGAKVVV